MIPCSIASSEVHEPSAFARSTAAIPAGAITPAASSRSIRALFVAAQPLPGFLGAKYSFERRSSTRPAVESTQPKHSASSTASSYANTGPWPCRQVTSHAPRAVA